MMRMGGNEMAYFGSGDDGISDEISLNVPSMDDQVLGFAGDKRREVEEGAMADTASSRQVLRKDAHHGLPGVIQEPRCHQMKANKVSLLSLCNEINSNAEWNRAHAQENKARREAAFVTTQLTSHDVVPSGKRQQGEGCEDDDQGILEAFETSDGCAALRITLLAAGFVIGPGGQSVRDISERSQTKIRSWNETFVHYGKKRRVRQIVVEGLQENVIHALGVIKAAVARYKDLCEGNYCNQFVDPIQIIMGVEFTYSPPPRKAVPYAAGILTKPPKASKAISDSCDTKVRNKTYQEACQTREMHRPLKGALSCESDQSNHMYGHGWSGAGAQRDDESSSNTSLSEKKWIGKTSRNSFYADQNLGLFEVPCDAFTPRYQEYRSPSCNQPDVMHHSSYRLFETKGPQNYMNSFPWTRMDTLCAPHTRAGEFRAECLRDNGHNCWQSGPRCTPSNSKSPIYQSYRNDECHIETRQRSDGPWRPNYDHMFADFGQKCRLTDDIAPARHETLASITPNLHVSSESPVHFKFEVTLDAHEAKRKLMFEE